MKKIITKLLEISFLTLIFTSAYSQKKMAGPNAIKSSDLESYITFLSSPFFKGRMNGSEGLDLATRYIATEARLIGLKPANNGSFFQDFYVISKSYDSLKTTITISADEKAPFNINKPFYQLLPMGVSDLELEGEVVFAGYGVKSDKYEYDDFDNLNTEGKILLIMNRAPMSEDGKNCLFKEPAWTTIDGLSLKLSMLLNLKAKAILIVMDPKSGSESLREEYPGLSKYLSTSMSLKSNEPQSMVLPGLAKVIIIHRDVADELLKDSGYTLEKLQKSIDSNLKPHSFAIEGKKLKITSGVLREEKILSNVAGTIQGSDPVLKNEIVIFSAHADHMGISDEGSIFAGADDDASGCAALLELAKAFSSLKNKPHRSIMFLWVSGEEIGLYGSESYVNNPLFPLANTIVDINLDMIGRTKSTADTSAANPMTGPNTVFIITDDQSSDLNKIVNKVDKKSILDFDYTLSGKNHPLHFFERSDQYNFVQNDIPILLFTTGIHSTYHTTDDTVDKIDFRKMELVTKDIYEIGYLVANRKKRIVVNNPYSSW
jgi:hypothetical protein